MNFAAILRVALNCLNDGSQRWLDRPRMKRRQDVCLLLKRKNRIHSPAQVKLSLLNKAFIITAPLPSHACM